MYKLVQACKPIAACPAAQGRPTSPTGVPRQPGTPWPGHRAPRQQPEERRLAALATPRCTSAAIWRCSGCWRGARGPGQGVPGWRGTPLGLVGQPWAAGHAATGLQAYTDSLRAKVNVSDPAGVEQAIQSNLHLITGAATPTAQRRRLSLGRLEIRRVAHPARHPWVPRNHVCARARAEVVSSPEVQKGMRSGENGRCACRRKPSK